MKYLIFLFVIFIPVSTFAQKSPKIIDKIDEFDGFRSVKAEKKKLGMLQLYTEAIITKTDTTYRAYMNVFNNGSIVDENKPYRVILANDSVYNLKIIHATIPTYYSSRQMFHLTFQIPNKYILDFLNYPITKGRIYYLKGTYDDVNGGVIETDLIKYLTAVYNRVMGTD